MQAIWKQQLAVKDRQEIYLPKDIEILCVQVQREIPCLWYINKNLSKAHRKKHIFLIYGTGHKHELINGAYIGTFQLYNGDLVFHLFEEKKEEN